MVGMNGNGKRFSRFPDVGFAASESPLGRTHNTAELEERKY